MKTIAKNNTKTDFDNTNIIKPQSTAFVWRKSSVIILRLLSFFPPSLLFLFLIFSLVH